MATPLVRGRRPNQRLRPALPETSNDLSELQDKMVAGERTSPDLLDISQDKMVAGAGFEPATFRL